MQHAQDFDFTVAHAIGNDVGQAAYDQFARSEHTSGAACCSMTCQRGFGLIDDLEYHPRRRGRAVLTDVSGNMVQVVIGEFCPAQPKASSPTFFSALHGL